MGTPIRHFRGHVVTVALGLTVAVGVFLVCLQLAGGLFAGETTTVRATVPTSASLGSGAKVAMAGAQVGRVTGIERRGLGTVVEMEITDERVLPIPADSRVTLRQRTPVGENYVEITPGDSRAALGADDVLPISQADEYVDVDELLSILQGRSREDARRLIQASGAALDGQGARLNRTLAATAGVVDDGGTLFGVLAEDRAQVARLVDRLGRVSATIGEQGEAIRVTANRGLAALRALGARDAELAATLREVPGTLRQVRGTSTLLRAAATTATPVVTNLTGTVRALRPAVRELRPAAQQARNAVRELGAAAPPLGGTVDRLRTLGDPLAGALPALHKTVCELAPVIRYTAPYTDDAIATVIGLGSASNSYDAVGHLIRLTPILGENSAAGLPDEITQASYTLLRAGLLGKSSPLTWNPYPEPGQIGKATATGGPSISGPKALGESGYRYPRVEADC